MDHRGKSEFWEGKNGDAKKQSRSALFTPECLIVEEVRSKWRRKNKKRRRRTVGIDSLVTAW